MDGIGARRAIDLVKPLFGESLSGDPPELPALAVVVGMVV